MKTFSKNAASSFEDAQLVWATLVCALMKGNPTLHLRKSKSTNPQEIPFSSCKRTDRESERRQTEWRHEEEDAVDKMTAQKKASLVAADGEINTNIVQVAC